MQTTIGRSTLRLLTGDITTQEVDAIVNAANPALAGGGGVDGAIHRAAGPALMAATRAEHPDGCPTGSAVITAAGDLPARFVIHTVGPVWHGGYRNDEAELRSAYRTSCELSVANECRSVAFPAVSCGVYGYPLDRAAAAAVDEVARFLQTSPPLEVRFVLFNAGIYAAFHRAAEAVVESLP